MTRLALLAGSALASTVGIVANSTLNINGRTGPADIRTIDGKPYVALSDVAKILNMDLQKKANGYVIIPAGGTYEMSAKTHGILGDELFTGDWRFKVLAVSIVDQYTPKHRPDAGTVQPNGAGDTLVVVDCRFKNGHKVKELMYFQNSGGAADNASLTDANEHAYEPVFCDAHLDYYNYAMYVLPGAAIDFSLVFSVPKGTKPNDLIYQILRYDDRGTDKKTTVRVALAKPSLP